MLDARFFLTNGPIAVRDALQLTGAAARGPFDGAALLKRAASLDETDAAEAVLFIEDAARAGELGGRRFGLCFAPADIAEKVGGAGVVAATAHPRASFAKVASILHSVRRFSDAGPEPAIAEDTQIHPTATVGPGAVIGRGAGIGQYAVIGPGVVIGAGAVVSERASVWCAILGEEVRIGAGTVIGGPGFGFAASEDGLSRVPQLGRVLVGDRVEIGANGCIDRGALGDTVIGSGTKIDNLVQIAHNVRIGENCVIAAQVGIAGSAKVGARVQFGGQAGIADHATIGDDARIAAKAGVMRNVPAGETWGGYPARPMMTWMRETAASARAAGREKKKASEHDDD